MNRRGLAILVGVTLYLELELLVPRLVLVEPDGRPFVLNPWLWDRVWGYLDLLSWQDIEDVVAASSFHTRALTDAVLQRDALCLLFQAVLLAVGFSFTVPLALWLGSLQTQRFLTSCCFVLDLFVHGLFHTVVLDVFPRSMPFQRGHLLWITITLLRAATLYAMYLYKDALRRR